MKLKLLKTRNEIREAQALRYQVFFRENSAKPNFRQKIFKRDFDLHDRIADHFNRYRQK